MKLKDATGEICSGLLDLTREGGPGNFMVVSSGEVYLQFSGSPGNPQVVCECVSNEYLPAKLEISAGAMEKLKALGFALSGGEVSNFSRNYDLVNEDQARELAELSTRIFQEVYAVRPDAEVQIEVSLE
ncbi:MAG TPA: hypothetical protein VLX58_21125 [Bryobacteraceae bacterium]|nr:hypothetical protein [Bryobacteraceae bacterium]